MTDTLTILRCTAPHTAAKHHPAPANPDDPRAKLGMTFTVRSVPVTSLADLSACLTQLRGMPGHFVIRGEPLPTIDPVGDVRRSNGPTATYAPAARQWVCLDIDSREDDGTFTSAPHISVDAIRYELPEQFRGAACYWHASGSAGIKPGVRVHMWFWLNRPVSDAEWKAWTPTWPVEVDEALFRTIQPHFTSDPVLGMPDPMSSRSGMLPGAPHVIVPPISTVSESIAQLAQKHLRKAVNGIRTAKEGGRNDTFARCALQAGSFSQLLGQQGLDALIDAAASIGCSDTKTHETITRCWREARPHHTCAVGHEWARGMSVTEAGMFTASDANVLQVAKRHPALKGVLVTDVRADKALISSTPPWDADEQFGPYPRPVTSSDFDEATIWFDREARLPGVRTKSVEKAITGAARRVGVDRFKAWLEQLEHDQVPRLDTWLLDAAGATDNPAYLKAVGSKWLISAVARTMRPGCDVHHALILVGAQGAGKSSVLKALVAQDEWFGVMQTKLGSDEAYRHLQGPVIVELAELAALSGRDIELVKTDITLTHDDRRRLYESTLTRFPRRCVYAGSTNNEEFLHDTTGNRRFWPVHVSPQIDVEWVRANRDQLWAEALVRYSEGEQWFPTTAEIALINPAQEAVRERDPFEDLLHTFLDTPQGKHTGFDQRVPQEWLGDGGVIQAVQVSTLALALGEKQGDSGVARRLARSLRLLGWESKKRKTGPRYWCRPNARFAAVSNVIELRGVK